MSTSSSDLAIREARNDNPSGDPLSRLNGLLDTYIHSPADSKPDESFFLLGQAVNTTSSLDVRQRFELLEKVFMAFTIHNQVDPEGFRKLLKPLIQAVPTQNILDSQVSSDFAQGLDPEQAEVLQDLTITCLQTLNEHAAENLVATRIDLCGALVTSMLLAPSSSIASRAREVIINIIALTGRHGTQRFLRDESIHERYFAICHATKNKMKLGRTQLAYAQTRLLDFLLKLYGLQRAPTLEADAGYHRYVLGSLVPTTEKAYGLKSGEGLLDLATTYGALIDKDDVLMGITVANTFARLLAADKNLSWSSKQSPSLDWLTSRGYHEEILMIFITKTPSQVLPAIDINYAHAEIAEYVASFVSSNGKLLIEDEYLWKRLKTGLQKPLAETSWRRPTEEAIDVLRVVRNLPRQLLLNEGLKDVLLLISLEDRSSAPFYALGDIFHGPDDPEAVQTFPARTLPPQNHHVLDTSSEQLYARQLFDRYVGKNPGAISAAIGSANVISIPELALAAISFLQKLINANWADPTGAVQYLLRNETATSELLSYLAGISNRPPWNKLDGPVRDKLQEIAEARYATAQALLNRVLALDAHGNEQIVYVLRDRLAKGVWGLQSGQGSNIPAVATATR